jgi:hypothetical protein
MLATCRLVLSLRTLALARRCLQLFDQQPRFLGARLRERCQNRIGDGRQEQREDRGNPPSDNDPTQGEA